MRYKEIIQLENCNILIKEKGKITSILPFSYVFHHPSVENAVLISNKTDLEDERAGLLIKTNEVLKVNKIDFVGNTNDLLKLISREINLNPCGCCKTQGTDKEKYFTFTTKSNDPNFTVQLDYNNKVTQVNVKLSGDIKESEFKKEIKGSPNFLSFDLSENTGSATFKINQANNLNKIRFNDKIVTQIEISNCTILSFLDVANNELKDLDISNNLNLEHLYAQSNELKELDVSNNLFLKTIGIPHNKLTKIDVSKNLDLRYLGFWNQKIKALDITKNIKLTTLGCANNELTELDLSNNTKLKILTCGANSFESIDLSNQLNLETLGISENLLTSLDIVNNLKLKIINCSYNSIKKLDVSKHEKISNLNCHDNLIDELDFSNSNSLEFLTLSNNSLKNLNLKTEINGFKVVGFSKNNELKCIEVNDVDQANNNIVLTKALEDLNKGSNNAKYAINCNI